MAATAALRSAFSDLVDELNIPLQPGAVLQPVDLPALRKTLLAKMNPRTTIANAIMHRLEIADWVRWEPQDPLDQIMIAPQFDTPMYEPLRDYGQTWIMPGIGTIPPDTVTLVKSNQRFIEAYMAGLSHEMGRELLYHEYPTDQRGMTAPEPTRSKARRSSSDEMPPAASTGIPAASTCSTRTRSGPASEPSRAALVTSNEGRRPPRSGARAPRA